MERMMTIITGMVGVLARNQFRYSLGWLASPIVYFFVAGLVFRVCAVFIVNNYEAPRDYEYGEIARNILAGKGYSRSLDTGGRVSLTASHAPLYPYFLYIMYNLGRTPAVYLIIELIQALLSALTILIIHRIAAHLFSHHVAGLAALVIAVYPALIYYCAKLVPTTILILLLSLTVMLVMECGKKNLSICLLAGVSFGMTILCDPVVLAAYPAIVVWWFLSRKIRFHQLCLVVFISFVPILPWVIRNYIAFKQCVPVTTQFGVNFWIGNNDRATGTDYYAISETDSNDYVLMTHTLPQTTRDSLASLDEIARTKYYLNEGLRFAVRKPGVFFRLLLKKTYYYWLFTPPNEYSSQDLLKYRILLLIFYLPVLLFSIGGMIFAVPRVKYAGLILLLMLFVSSVYIFTHVGLTRYRVILEPYMIIFASGFAKERIIPIIRKRNT